MTVKIWQSKCIVCGEIYQLKIVNDDGHYNAEGISNGICPDCMEKREKRRRKWMEDFVNGREK